MIKRLLQKAFLKITTTIEVYAQTTGQFLYIHRANWLAEQNRAAPPDRLQFQNILSFLVR